MRRTCEINIFLDFFANSRWLPGLWNAHPWHYCFMSNLIATSIAFLEDFFINIMEVKKQIFFPKISVFADFCGFSHNIQIQSFNGLFHPAVLKSKSKRSLRSHNGLKCEDEWIFRCESDISYMLVVVTTKCRLIWNWNMPRLIRQAYP